jgi:hypothetical protein
MLGVLERLVGGAEDIPLLPYMAWAHSQGAVASAASACSGARNGDVLSFYDTLLKGEGHRCDLSVETISKPA